MPLILICGCVVQNVFIDAGGLAGGRPTSDETGDEKLIRMAIAAGVILAPQLGVGVTALILTVGHIGTAVPVLLIWLLVDRAPQRWWVPVLTGLGLAATHVAGAPGFGDPCVAGARDSDAGEGGAAPASFGSLSMNPAL